MKRGEGGGGLGFYTRTSCIIKFIQALELMGLPTSSASSSDDLLSCHTGLSLITVSV